MRKRAVMSVMVAICALAAGANAADSSQVARGRYLVDNVGMCDDCHTPRDGSGRPDGTRRLQGAPLEVRPIVPMPGWADAAPPLAGGSPSGWTRPQLVEFLHTGLKPNGQGARPPMPAFRLTRQDAEAVAVYLESRPRVEPTLNTKATTR